MFAALPQPGSASAAAADNGRSSVNVRLKPGKQYITYEQFQSMAWGQRTELFAAMYDDLDRPGGLAIFRSHDSAKLRRLLTGTGPPSKPHRAGATMSPPSSANNAQVPAKRPKARSQGQLPRLDR